MEASWLLRLFLPILPAVLSAAVIHQWSIKKGWEPPGFRRPGRRWTMAALLAFVLYLGVFSPAAWFGTGPAVDLEAIRVPDLFFLHGVLLLSLLIWFALGYGSSRREQLESEFGNPRYVAGAASSSIESLAGDDGRLAAEAAGAAVDAAPMESSETAEAKAGGQVSQPGTPWQELVSQCGLRTAWPMRELAFGLCAGAPLWIAVVVVMALVALLLQATGAGELLPKDLPPMVGFLAGLPILVRLGLSLSAGVVEEIFFRGFLQRRVGVLFSTLLFVLAHLSYDQPMMLLGITFLSLAFAWLTLRRKNIYPAIAAHFAFDAVQLLWFVPAQMGPTPELEGSSELVAVVALWIC